MGQRLGRWPFLYSILLFFEHIVQPFIPFIKFVQHHTFFGCSDKYDYGKKDCPKIRRKPMIKVLPFVSTPAIWSGVMSAIMNYYRHIDRSRVQFDFLCFLPCEESYEKEINELGGQVFFMFKILFSRLFFIFQKCTNCFCKAVIKL